MIQHRTLELLQNPTAIQSEDLSILEKDITKFPYMQSVRALYLYGTHLHKPSAFADLLTRTAAYTTEKKILYQLIQSQYAVRDTPTAVSDMQSLGEINQPTEEIIEENPLENNKTEARFEESLDINNKNAFIDDKTASKNELTAVRNEENAFRNDKTASENELTAIRNEENAFRNNKTASENELTAVGNDKNAFRNDKTATDNHFQATEIEISTEENEILATENNFNETKTQILAEENGKSLTENHFNTTEIEIKGTENEIKNSKSEMSKAENEIQQPNNNLQPATCNLKASVNNKTDRHQEEMKRLIAEVEAKMAKNRLERQKNQEIAKKEETEILNNDLNFSEVEREIEVKEKAEEKISEKPSETQSNIPDFINTWQSWLKIGESRMPIASRQSLFANDPSQIIENEEPKANSEQRTANINSHIIDTFIENAPKITKKEKENADFGEKNKDKVEDDISHLMTETLANLYVSQRLYSRAVNAFETLAEKHPERSEYFIERANEVKDMKLGKFYTEE